jgi:hypothetical protein
MKIAFELHLQRERLILRCGSGRNTVKPPSQSSCTHGTALAPRERLSFATGSSAVMSWLTGNAFADLERDRLHAGAPRCIVMRAVRPMARVQVPQVHIHGCSR